MGDLTRVSLSIDEKLLEKLEAMAQDSGYQNRSEFIRDLIRERKLWVEFLIINLSGNYGRRSLQADSTRSLFYRQNAIWQKNIKWDGESSAGH